MGWNFEDGKPIHVQLIDEIVHRIITGAYQPGSRLPSVRELAFEASVNPNTMQRALSSLEESGLIYSERTNGRFVTDNSELIEKAKADIAKTTVLKFFFAMNELGFDRNSAIEAAKELKEVK